MFFPDEFTLLQSNYKHNRITESEYEQKLQHIVSEIQQILQQNGLESSMLYDKILYTTNPNNSDMKGDAKLRALESIIQSDLTGIEQRA